MSEQTTSSKVTLDDVLAARERVSDYVTASPLIQLTGASLPDGVKVYLKLENLQPVGSFKVRGAANTLLSLPLERLREEGVATVSTGNFGHALAYVARQLGVACRVVVPDHVPRAKMGGALRHGAEVTRVPWAEWWGYIDGTREPDFPGVFIHPEGHDEILAGTGTLGLEIVEQLPEVDAVLIPYGGGGMTAGVGTVLKAMRPECKVVACEVNTAAPLTEALKHGTPTPVTFHSSFVDGIGSNCVLDHVWDTVRDVVDEAAVVSLDDIRGAVRLLAERHHVIAEGAGAATTAAVLAGKIPEGAKNVVCIVSGGNIDFDVLSDILAGDKQQC